MHNEFEIITQSWEDHDFNGPSKPSGEGWSLELSIKVDTGIWAYMWKREVKDN